MKKLNRIRINDIPRRGKTLDRTELRTAVGGKKVAIGTYSQKEKVCKVDYIDDGSPTTWV